MKKIIIPVFALLALVLGGCGQTHEARSMVKNFMADEMGLADMHVVTWSKLDSTFFLKPGVMHTLQLQARHSGMVRPQTRFHAYTPKLLLMHVVSEVKGDTMSHTFYFDDKLQGIVGVKVDMPSSRR